jgi:hypothetical protein
MCPWKEMEIKLFLSADHVRGVADSGINDHFKALRRSENRM